jgi:hypothetical protein
MEGTQMATNNPLSFAPLNHNVTDSRNDSPAAISMLILLMLIQSLMTSLSFPNLV